ncbi:unnamed protein product [[Candida] boidinii]|nr:unnamed protein product [[Candida] boidinii]
MTVPEVVISTPVTTLTTTVTCASCKVAITSTVTSVVSFGSAICTGIIVVIGEPPQKSSIISYTVVTNELYFPNTTMQSTVYEGFSSSIDHRVSHIDSSSATVNFPSASILTPESLVETTSTISSVTVSTASVSNSEISFPSFRSGRTLESPVEYVTWTNILSIQSDILLKTPYEDKTLGASVTGGTESSVSLSSSSSGESTETPTQYTDGSAGIKSHRIFIFLSAVICVILII